MRYLSRLLLLTGLLSASAHADPNDKPPNDKALVQKGLQLRREHRDAEALELFRQAHEARASARTLAQIALAEQALGQWVEADRDLRAALAFADEPWIASYKAALEGALEAIGKHVATLVLKANPASAEVWLNGQLVGEAPTQPLRVAAGSLRIELRAKGHESASRTVELAPGATVTAEIELTAVPEPVQRASLPVTTTESELPVPKSDTPVTLRAASAESPAATTRHAIAWGSLGAAGAFLVGAAVAQLVREEKASRYNDDSRCLYGELSRDQRCGVYRGQVESAQAFANIGYIAAGALGIGSAILFLVNPAKPKTGGLSFSVDVGPSNAELSVGGRL